MSRIFAQHDLSLRKTAIALLIPMVLMLFDSQHPDWFSSVRDAAHVSMQPINQFSALPSFVGHWADGTLQSKEALRRRNLKLQTELMHANAKLQHHDYILSQNARLQGVLSTTKPEQYDLHLAQVIGTDTNPLKQIVVLNKGREDGVKVGQTAIDENGILGQIINVYPNTSRLLLVTDEIQSVSVMVRRTGQRAIVSGLGTPDALSLDYVFKTSDIKIGDELVSSGLGGRFPAGYRMGTVAFIDPVQQGDFMTIEVKPAANFVDSSYLLIMQDKTQSVSSVPAEAASVVGGQANESSSELSSNPLS